MSLFYALYFLLFTPNIPAEKTASDTHLVGVYKGRPLFVKNAYDPVAKTFCVVGIEVNDKKVRVPENLSAIKIDFDGIDLYAPVAIRIIHSDSCRPIVINPDAILYHTLYSFREVTATDTLITWKTTGERQGGTFYVEKIDMGLWQEQATIPGKGVFGGTSYTYQPRLDQGSNKYRIKYVFPSGEEYLFSQEIDMHYYPDPVTFSPKKTTDLIKFSRPAYYEIFDAGSKKVLDGTGDQVDVSNLPVGDYVIYFDGDDPGMFIKDRVR